MQKNLSFTLLFVLFFVGCANKEIAPSLEPQAEKVATQVETKDTKSSWLDEFVANENYDELLELFRHNCTATLTKQVYSEICAKALKVGDSKKFFEDEFELKKIESDEKRAMLTGYYEPLLQGSLKKTERYRYPIYAKPKDLVTIVGENDKRMRGRSVKGKMLPYFTRAEISKKPIKADVLCYVDNKIDLYFLEVQGSGRVELDDGRVLFVGYADANGHAYKSLGREMINRGIFNSPEEVSMQKIRAWLDANPSKIDELLNTNPSFVFFRIMQQRATGSLGLVLTPERSVAVDRSLIPLGSLLFVKSKSDVYEVERFVFAQDTGGAIKGSNRADMFLGYGSSAEWIAGNLKAPLEIWIMQPKVQNW